jgi:hypothetical protein
MHLIQKRSIIFDLFVFFVFRHRLFFLDSTSGRRPPLSSPGASRFSTLERDDIRVLMSRSSVVVDDAAGNVVVDHLVM